MLNAKVVFFSLLLVSCSHVKIQKDQTYSAQYSEEDSLGDVINDFAHEQKEAKIQSALNEELETQEFLRNVKNQKVQFWINYFAKKDKKRFERYLRNGAKYQRLIEATFEDYGLPKDLYFVGLIESGYYLRAKSSANAVGPWQFIRSTGKRYGLKINSRVDERKSIFKSTQAAALFFQDLYNIFGSWELALSAYNAGEYGIIRRIRKANTRDFYELSRRKKLPKETRHYVPKVLAAMEIFKNPTKYGVTIPQASTKLLTTTKVELPHSFDIRRLAKKINISKAQIKKLNPDLKSYYTPTNYELVLPQGNYAKLKELKPQKRSRPSSNIAYKVKSGDNLISLAKKHGVTVAEIKALNNLRSNKIYIGQKLRFSSNSKGLYANSKQTEKITVKRGDNLYQLARIYGTSVSKIMSLNNLNKKTIYVGQRLKLPQRHKTIHTVKPGEYLIKIAKSYGVSVAQIKSLNGVRSHIYPGQKLVIKFH